MTVPISPEAFETAGMPNTPQGFQTLSLNDSTHEVGLNVHNVMKARRMKTTIKTALKDNTPTDVDNTAYESAGDDDHKNTTQSTTDQVTAPLPIEDDKSAEASHQAEVTNNVDSIPNDNSEDSWTTAEEGLIIIEEDDKHTYFHAHPAMNIIEINESMAPKMTNVADTGDTGVSASSVGRNFERYLKEDKMQWVHDMPDHPEVYIAPSKTKKQAIKATNSSTQDGKPIDSDTEVDFHHHTRRLSNEYVTPFFYLTL